MRLDTKSCIPESSECFEIVQSSGTHKNLQKEIDIKYTVTIKDSTICYHELLVRFVAPFLFRFVVVEKGQSNLSHSNVTY